MYNAHLFSNRSLAFCFRRWISSASFSMPLELTTSRTSCILCTVFCMYVCMCMCVCPTFHTVLFSVLCVYACIHIYVFVYVYTHTPTSHVCKRMNAVHIPYNHFTFIHTLFGMERIKILQTMHNIHWSRCKHLREHTHRKKECSNEYTSPDLEAKVYWLTTLANASCKKRKKSVKPGLFERFSSIHQTLWK